MHDLFRERLLSDASAGELRELSQSLARIAMARSGLDIARWARDATRHLIAADRHEDACRLLVERAPEMVKVGGTRDLLALLESIPADRRTVDAQLARARCLVRMVRVPEALAEMRRLVDREIGPKHEALYSLAGTTFMAGNVKEALDAYRQLLDDRGVPQTLKDQVALAFVWSATMAGRGEEGRARISDAQKRAQTSHDAALFAFYRAVSLWADDMDEACERALAEAGALDPTAAPPFAVGNLVPPLLAAILARLRRTDEAKAYRAMADEQEKAAGEDLQGRMQSLRLAATYQLEIGDAASAVATLGDLSRAYDRGGNVVSALVCKHWYAKALLATGKAEQAVAVLDDVAARAQELGLSGIASNVARVRMRVSTGGVVLDCRSNELRLPDRTVSLKGRPTLCRILYALAKAPNETHSKESLAHLLWGDRYHPLRHDNAFWVNMRRLRKLIEKTGLSVEHLEDGYKLMTPPGFVVLA